jgi:hypothetical protein
VLTFLSSARPSGRPMGTQRKTSGKPSGRRSQGPQEKHCDVFCHQGKTPGKNRTLDLFGIHAESLLECILQVFLCLLPCLVRSEIQTPAKNIIYLNLSYMCKLLIWMNVSILGS